MKIILLIVIIIIIRALIIEIMIGRIMEVVMKITITAIKINYKANSMEKKKKAWLEQEIGLVKTDENIFYWRLQAYSACNLQ